MSAVVEQGDSPFAARRDWWTRIDVWGERGSERLNPILVKEARQAMKSRQFLITFSLLLLCGWAWSLIGVTVQMPNVYYEASGPFLLSGYFVILTVPMLLIVPFAAYRSLAAEREDGTYELVSITTLTARQIVTGKLGSAILQMIVYYSALSPCIAFTYLLRGVDVITIGLVLSYTFLASVLLSALGLAVATATRSRHVQLLLSVVLLLGLVFLTIMWCVWSCMFIWESGIVSYDEPAFWISQIAILTGYASYLALFVLGAAAQISFASDNRSTRLRIIMLAQQILFLGWMMLLWLTEKDDDILYGMLTFSAIHWTVMGALMTGEWSLLSPRVKRSLPQSFVGRTFLTWFNPGSGTGYVFAVVSMAGVVAVSLLTVAFAAVFLETSIASRALPDGFEFTSFGVLLVAYLAAYLGVGRLLTLWMRRRLSFGLLLPFLIDGVLIALGAAVPFFVQIWIEGFDRLGDYSVLQSPNWMWTLFAAADGDLMDALVAPALAILAAGVIFVVNLAVAAREIAEVREATPVRIVEDEREQYPERFVEKPLPKSPFDD